MLRAGVGQIDEGRQLLVMEVLDHHLAGCQEPIGREHLRRADGRRVEHLVRSGRSDLGASDGLEDIGTSPRSGRATLP